MFGKRVLTKVVCTCASAVLIYACYAAFFSAKTSSAETPALPDLSSLSIHPDVRSALEATIEGVKREPTAIAAWRKLALSLKGHGFDTEAAPCFAWLANQQPDEAKWPYFQGLCLEQTDIRAAEVCFRRSVALQPNNPAVYVRCARSIARRGNLQSAYDLLLSTDRTFPSNPHIELELGRLAASLGDTSSAVDFCTSAVSRNGWYARPGYVELARLAYLNGNIDKAATAWEKMSAMPEATSDVLDTYIKDIFSFDALRKNDAAQVDQLLAAGKVWQAIEAYRKIVSKRPDLLRPQLNLGHAYLMAGQPQAAFETLTQAVNNFPESPNAWAALAAMLQSIGQPQNAIKAYQKCTELSSLEYKPYFNMAILLAEDNQLKEAEAAFRKAISLEPQFAPAYFSLGLTLERLGNFTAAIDALKTAVALKPGDPVPLTKLKQIQHSINPDDAAIPN